MQKLIFAAFLLGVIALANAHMWIYDPDPNRYGEDGGQSINSSPNSGHDNAHQGNSQNQPCGGVAFVAANQKKVTQGTSFNVQWTQSDVSNGWDVFFAAQPDSNLVNNKIATVTGAFNTQHTQSLTFKSAGNWTVQVANTGGGGGYISCADFLVAPTSTSSSSIMMPIAILSFALAMIAML